MAAAGVATVGGWLCGGDTGGGACDGEPALPVETGVAAVAALAVAATIGGVAGAEGWGAAGVATAAVWVGDGNTGGGVGD